MRGGKRASSEVVPLNLERAPICEVALHDFHHGLREAHAQQGPLDFGVSVDLAQLEEATSDLCRVLQKIRKSGVARKTAMQKTYCHLGILAPLICGHPDSDLQRPLDIALLRIHV